MDEQQQQCTICMAPLLEDAPGALTCGHVFHIECITKWIARKVADNALPKCPSCNTQVSVSGGIISDIAPVTFPTSLNEAWGGRGSLDEIVIDGEEEEDDTQEIESPESLPQVAPVIFEPADEAEVQRLTEEYEVRQQEISAQLEVEKSGMKEDRATRKDQVATRMQLREKSRLLSEHALPDIEGRIAQMHSDCQAVQDRIDASARQLAKGLPFPAPKEGDADVEQERMKAGSQSEAMQRLRHFHEGIIAATQQERQCKITLKENYRRVEEQKSALKEMDDEKEVLMTRLKRQREQREFPSKSLRSLRSSQSDESFQNSQNLTPPNHHKLSQAKIGSQQVKGRPRPVLAPISQSSETAVGAGFVVADASSAGSAQQLEQKQQKHQQEEDAALFGASTPVKARSKTLLGGRRK